MIIVDDKSIATKFRITTDNRPTWKILHHTSYSIWQLKLNDPPLKWKIIDRGRQFHPVTKICRLGCKEKFHILDNRIIELKYLSLVPTKRNSYLLQYQTLNFHFRIPISKSNFTFTVSRI